LGAYRQIRYKRLDGMKREDSQIMSKDNYLRNSVDSLNGSYMPNVKQWMINRYFQIDKDWAISEKDNWNWLLSNFNNISHSDNSFKFDRIGRDLEPVFILNNKECYLEELSSGFQSILSIIFAIFEWVEKTNEKGDRLVKNARGTVIIDEVDAHLHPEWQLEVREILDIIFPNLQFIMTTHSPHIIASAKENEVIIMSHSEDETELEPTKKVYSGWKTDYILQDVMGVNNLENKEYNQMISEALNSIVEKDTSKLEGVIKRLEEISHKSDVIVESLIIQLATLELGTTDD